MVQPARLRKFHADLPAEAQVVWSPQGKQAAVRSILRAVRDRSARVGETLVQDTLAPVSAVAALGGFVALAAGRAVCTADQG